MRKAWVLTLLLLFVVSVTASAADDPMAILDKAIKAHGGAEKLGKMKASTWKSKGKFYGATDPVEFTADWAIQAPDKFKADIEGKFGAAVFKQVKVIAGDKGWTKSDDDSTKEMDKDEVADEKRQLAVRWLSTLLPLKDKSYELTTLPETRSFGDVILGIKATAGEAPPVSLFFNKDKGLLVKMETTVKEPGRSKEIKEEVYYEDYKEVDGIQRAMKVTIRRDGKKFLEQELSDVKFAPELDKKMFEKP